MSVGVCFGFAFDRAASFPARLFPILSIGIVSAVSLMYLLIPLMIRTRETVLSPSEDSIVISTP